MYYVYVLVSPSHQLYIGVTNDLTRRIAEHRGGLDSDGWAHKHGATRLAYFELTHDARAAIAREKQIKNWRRRKKIQLIESGNPGWNELASAPSLRSG